MKRKVIQIAGSTCLVSLPKEWIKKHDVKKGAELEVQEQGNKVVVSTEKSQTLPKITIDHARFGRFHPNFLSSAYNMGFDDVEVHFSDSKELAAIQEKINSCIGYEIVNQSNNVCYIKSVSEVSLEEFSQIMRKVFLLLINMGENTLGLLEKGDFGRLSEVMILEKSNNKLTDFCKRVLNKRGYHDYSKLTTIYTVCMYLERVADEYRDICSSLLNKKEKLSPSVLKDFKEVNQLFVEFYNLFYTADRMRLEKIFFTVPQMKKGMLEKISKAQPADRIVIHASSNILNEIYELATASVELHL